MFLSQWPVCDSMRDTFVQNFLLSLLHRKLSEICKTVFQYVSLQHVWTAPLHHKLLPTIEKWSISHNTSACYSPGERPCLGCLPIIFYFSTEIFKEGAQLWMWYEYRLWRSWWWYERLCSAICKQHHTTQPESSMSTCCRLFNVQDCSAFFQNSFVKTLN